MQRVIVLIVFLMFCKPVLPQEKDTATTSTYKYWMTLGIMDISTNYSYIFSIKDNFYKVGYLLRSNSFFGYTKFQTVDISIGKRMMWEWFQISYFAGPSVVFGKQQNKYNNLENYTTPGAQIDAQILFRLAKEIGIGIGLYANLNFKESFGGANINFTLGNGK